MNLPHLGLGHVKCIGTVRPFCRAAGASHEINTPEPAANASEKAPSVWSIRRCG